MSLLEGFKLYNEPEQPLATGKDHYTIATPPGTRLMRIIRLPRGWRLWISTRDYVYGTYYEAFDDGRMLNCTTRMDEGDEFQWIRPSDAVIRGTSRTP